MGDEVKNSEEELSDSSNDDDCSSKESRENDASLSQISNGRVLPSQKTQLSNDGKLFLRRYCPPLSYELIGISPISSFFNRCQLVTSFLASVVTNANVLENQNFSHNQRPDPVL